VQQDGSGGDGGAEQRDGQDHERDHAEAAAAAAGLWVWAPSGIPMATVLLLVPGGGLLPVADLEGETVDGAGAGPLDAAVSLAARADRSLAAAALDVPGALAPRAGAERGQVQEPTRKARTARTARTR
jgi:hypothetical protein